MHPLIVIGMFGDRKGVQLAELGQHGVDSRNAGPNRAIRLLGCRDRAGLQRYGSIAAGDVWVIGAVRGCVGHTGNATGGNEGTPDGLLSG